LLLSAADNAIYAIPDAHGSGADQVRGRGRLAVKDDTHLRGPLGLVRAPNGDLISAQGDAVNPDAKQPSEIVEFTAGGKFLTEDVSINGLRRPTRRAAEMGRRRNVGGLPTWGRRP
jgi:hypothetical protein